jgi:pantoate--beta-alanine ligase
MRILGSPKTMQRQALQWRREGLKVGFVPTMGYLHEGHLSLVREARRRVGAGGIVVLSIYVNPTQFAPTEDLAKYPRNFERDCRMCREAGVDVVFAPTDQDMYPGREVGDYTTYVVEEGLTQRLEGASRPTHFRGVTTVVAKLFHCVLPEVSVFGVKDWQQAAVVQRMVRDLQFPVRIVVAPTIREADGLAMSSRNRYLQPAERVQAAVLWRSLEWARRTVRAGQIVTRAWAGTRPVPWISAGDLRRGVEELVATCPDARLDYVDFVDPETLIPVDRVQRGHRMVLAVFVGKTRLIDNAAL